jgi:hypothetical protein
VGALISLNFTGAFAKFLKAIVSFLCLSVRRPICASTWKSAFTGRIFVKFDTRIFF